MVGGVVALGMTREMGPVITALMVAGRAGSAIAAELGMMKVTEQLDALQSMAVNPVHYLVSRSSVRHQLLPAYRCRNHIGYP